MLALIVASVFGLIEGYCRRHPERFLQICKEIV